MKITLFLVFCTSSFVLGTPIPGSDVNDILPLAKSSDFFKVRNYGREEAAIETEGPLSKLDSKYDQLKHFISNLFGREPVVDNTREEDKYGNEGVVSQAIANTVVGGYEKISNAVNAAIEIPQQAFNVAKKNAGTVLGQVGAKLFN